MNYILYVMVASFSYNKALLTVEIVRVTIELCWA